MLQAKHLYRRIVGSKRSRCFVLRRSVIAEELQHGDLDWKGWRVGGTAI